MYIIFEKKKRKEKSLYRSIKDMHFILLIISDRKKKIMKKETIANRINLFNGVCFFVKNLIFSLTKENYVNNVI